MTSLLCDSVTSMTWTEAIVRGGVAVGVLGAVTFWGDFPFGGPHWDPEYIPAYPRKKRPKAWMSSLASQGSGRPGQAVGRFDVETFGFPTNAACFHKKIPPPKFNDVALQKLPKPSRKGSSLPATMLNFGRGMLCLLFGV